MTKTDHIKSGRANSFSLSNSIGRELGLVLFLLLFLLCKGQTQNLTVNHIIQYDLVDTSMESHGQVSPPVSHPWESFAYPTEYLPLSKDWPGLHYGVFCRLENKFNAHTGLWVKFRLSSFDRVDRLEGKETHLQIE